MTLPRRQFLQLAAGAIALPAASPWVARHAAAQVASYPSRPVRIIVTFPPGGANDIHARFMGQWLSERFGQPFVVENRAGGGGNVGTEAAVRSPPDGYTLVYLSTALAVNASFYEKLPYDFLRDIAPVASFYRSFYLMLVSPSSPVKTVSEFIDYAKANPGRINFGSNGVGATGHLAGEMFKIQTGISMVHVPYRGEAPAMADVMGGQIQVIFATLSGGLDLVRNGQLRAIAVCSAVRATSLPDVPTVGETLPGFEVSTWGGLGAPRNTPADVIGKLNAEINAGLASPRIKTKYTDLGLTILPGTPAEFGRLLAEETEKWAKVIKLSGMKAG